MDPSGVMARLARDRNSRTPSPARYVAPLAYQWGKWCDAYPTGSCPRGSLQVSTRDQRSSMKMIAAAPSQPSATTRLSTIRTIKDRADPLQPSVHDAMLAAVPSLRAFAISLSGKVDHADDLVQETLLRAMASINSFQPGTHMSAWLITILRNLFRSEYRKRRREVEDTNGSYMESLSHIPNNTAVWNSKNFAWRLQSCR
jgi:Sigma-70 region 2